jgi:hypothetical protein
MARVEWALFCDLAYFDTYRNLCVIGAPTRSPVPTLAAGTHRLTIVARVIGLRSRLNVAVSVSTPDGPRIATTFCERLEVEVIGDYLLVRLGGVPLAQEGIYRFEVSVSPSECSSIDLPVQVVAPRGDSHAPSHERQVGLWDSRGTSLTGDFNWPDL